MRSWPATTQRLLLVFAILFVLLSAASYSALRGLSDVQGSLHEVTQYNAEMRTTLALASAVRDQYAHEAHTIILGNESHLPYHKASHEAVQGLIKRLREQVQDTDLLAQIREIEEANAEQDSVFYAEVVPAVLARDADGVQSAHSRILGIVSSIQARADRLAEHFEALIREADARATAIGNRVFLWLILSHACALLFALAAALYLGRSVAQPLALLEQQASRLGRGDLNTVIAIDSDDEFGRLARSFNDMTHALKEHQEKLLRTEKLAVVGRLAAGVAHEINNPLGVILGYVKLLRKKAEGSLDDDLKVIEEEAVRTQEIVEGLLDLSRPFRAGDEPVDLRRLCDEVVMRLEGLAKDFAQDFAVTGEAVVEGNARALRQVLLNVIKNAAEAAGPEGRVVIELSGGDEVLVQVRDSGPGISETARAHLFEPFFTTRPRGTGLGLAVSRAILLAHGGNIDAENVSDGGAMFTIRLEGAGDRTKEKGDRAKEKEETQAVSKKQEKQEGPKGQEA